YRLVGLVLVVGEEQVDPGPAPDAAPLVDPPDVVAEAVGEMGADVPGGAGDVEQRPELHRLRLRRRAGRPGQQRPGGRRHRLEHVPALHRTPPPGTVSRTHTA